MFLAACLIFCRRESVPAPQGESSSIVILFLEHNNSLKTIIFTIIHVW